MSKALAILLLLLPPVCTAETLILISTIEAEASATFGMDLGKDGSDIHTGFETSAEFNFKLNMIDASSEELGEGDFHGWLEFKDLSVTIDAVDLYPDSSDPSMKAAETGIALSGIDVDFGEINAELRYANAYVNIFAEENTVDRASHDVSHVSAISLASLDSDTPLSRNIKNEAGLGIGFGYTFLDGSATVEFGLASGYRNTRWYDADNTYLLSAALEFTDLLGGMTLKFNASQWFNVEQVVTAAEYDSVTGEALSYDITEVRDLGETAAGFFVQYDYAINDSIILRPALGLDVIAREYDINHLIQDDYLVYVQTAAALNLVWPDLGMDADNDDQDEDDYFEFSKKKVDLTSGIGFGVNLSFFSEDGEEAVDVFKRIFRPPLVDFFLTFYEDSGDEGIIPFMGAQLLLNYAMDNGMRTDANQTQEEATQHFGIAFYTDFQLGEIFTPFAGFILQIQDLANTVKLYEEKNSEGRVIKTEKLTSADKINMEVKAGLTISPQPNTSITLAYASGNLLGSSENNRYTRFLNSATGKRIGTTRAFFNSDNTNFTSSNLGKITLEASVTFGK